MIIRFVHAFAELHRKVERYFPRAEFLPGIDGGVDGARRGAAHADDLQLMLVVKFRRAEIFLYDPIAFIGEKIDAVFRFGGKRRKRRLYAQR